VNPFKTPARGLNPAGALLTAALLLPVGALAQGAAAGSSAATSGAASAQAPSPGSQPETGAGGAMSTKRSVQSPSERVEERITQLHSQLGITPAQETLWNAFAQVMRDNASHMEQRLQERASGFAKLNAADNLNSYAAIAEEHAQDMQHLAATFQPLYAAFSDEQKRTADQLFRRRPGAQRARTAARR
jgi:periplasmic protein CpxP/Spy